MRIAYYVSEEARAAGTFNVKEISNAYALGDSKLICDNLAFGFYMDEPYQDNDLDELLMLLLSTGYLDLRSLKMLTP